MLLLTLIVRPGGQAVGQVILAESARVQGVEVTVQEGLQTARGC